MGEMTTMFRVNGAKPCSDSDGRCIGYDDVFTLIDKCRQHCAGNRLGEGCVDPFIR